MGGNESSLIPGLQQESKINHERFATREIIKNKDGEETIAITVAVPSEREYKSWVEQLEKVTKNQALLLPIEHSFNRSGFCGSAGVVRIVFDNYPFILSDQIHNRQCLNARFFQQNQLWYLALTLLTAVQQFHQRGKKAGDVRPMNVFIAQDGTVKLACCCSWPLQRSNYEKSFEKEATYLAPEEVIQLAYAKTQPNSDIQLAQTFSVGLTLLDAATLGDSTELYKNCKQIDYQGLQTRLADLTTKNYSNPLVQMITNMCEASPQGRTPVKELLDWLTPYETAINNFTAFTPESLPSKFNKSSILPNQSEYNSTFNPKPYISAYTPPPTLPPVTYYTSSKPEQTVTVPIPSTSSYITSPPQSYFPAPISSVAVAQSTYVPFSSKFSLEKIDEQLAQSRKNFPS